MDGATPKSDKRVSDKDALVSLLLVFIGLTSVAMFWYTRPPNAADLVPAEGLLLSYERCGGGRRGVASCPFYLSGHRQLFRSDAIRAGHQPVPGSTVRVLFNPHRPPLLRFGPVSTYGAWVNGVEVESPEEDFDKARVRLYGFGPIAALIAIVGLMRLRKWWKQEKASIVTTIP